MSKSQPVWKDGRLGNGIKISKEVFLKLAEQTNLTVEEKETEVKVTNNKSKAVESNP